MSLAVSLGGGRSATELSIWTSNSRDGTDDPSKSMGQGKVKTAAISRVAGVLESRAANGLNDRCCWHQWQCSR